MIVYGDLLFLINFSMDFLCFYISCAILHKKLSIARACIASVLGGVYSVAALFIITDGVIAFICDLLVLILMCLLVYIRRGLRIRDFIKVIFTYLFISMLLGGVMTALFSLFNRFDLFLEELEISEGIDVWIFAFLVVISSILTLGGGKIFKSSQSKRTAEIEINSEDSAIRLDALVDSGNLATEPISGRPIVFADIEKCREIVDVEEISNFYDNFDISALTPSVASKIRLVPTTTVGEGTLLPAMRFKSVYIIEKRIKREIQVYVAFVKAGALGEYGAIISSEVMD